MVDGTGGYSVLMLGGWYVGLVPTENFTVFPLS
jgi:hypothetical protein